jgi:hypothetical protein
MIKFTFGHKSAVQQYLADTTLDLLSHNHFSFTTGDGVTTPIDNPKAEKTMPKGN